MTVLDSDTLSPPARTVLDVMAHLLCMGAAIAPSISSVALRFWRDESAARAAEDAMAQAKWRN